VVSLQLSVVCLAATRRGAREKSRFRIAEWGADHESRVMNHAKAQWPNKAICPQAQGRPGAYGSGLKVMKELLLSVKGSAGSAAA